MNDISTFPKWIAKQHYQNQRNLIGSLRLNVQYFRKISFGFFDGLMAWHFVICSKIGKLLLKTEN